jgi:hypothetical protein
MKLTNRQVCGAYAARGDETAEVFLQRMTGASLFTCWRAIVCAERRGLILYGVSLRTGWLSKAGEVVLKSEVTL